MYMYFIIYQQSKKKVMCDAICVDMIIFCDMTIIWIHPNEVFRDLDLRKEDVIYQVSESTTLC